MILLTALAYLTAFVSLLIAVWVVAQFVRECRNPSPPRHTPDCLDWRAGGNRDTTCTAEHGTDWFGPRDQVQLINDLDGQLSIGESK